MRLKKLIQYPLRGYVLRLLAGLFPTLLLVCLWSGVKFTEPAFYGGLSFASAMVCWAALFLFLCFIKSDKAVFCLLAGAALLYLCVCAYEAQDWPFTLACCLALFLTLWFFEAPALGRLRPGALWCALGGMILLYTLFVGGICCVYYLRYRTPCFDFGLFAQMFYYMKETGRCLITCERDRLLSHFAVHFSPIYYLYLPVYVLLPDPRTLLVLQPLTVAAGAIPLALICRQKGLSDKAAFCFAGCLLAYPAFMGGCFFYLHENCFLTPLLLWLAYFYGRKNPVPAFVFAGLTLLVKEDAPVYVAALSLYFLFAHKNYKRSISILVLSVVYFIAVTGLINAYGDGIMAASRFGIYMYDGGGLTSVIKSVLLNPAFALKEIFAKEKLLFLLQTLAPLAFLPLAIKKPAGLWLITPMLLVNLMPRYAYQYHIGYQYAFGSGALLFYLAVTNYAAMGKHRGKILLCALLSGAVLFAGGYMNKTDALRYYRQEQAERETITEALALIPPEAEVTASTFLLANLSQRDTVWELERTKQKAQYVAMDLRFNKENRVEPYTEIGYEVLYYKENVIAVLRHE